MGRFFLNTEGQRKRAFYANHLSRVGIEDAVKLFFAGARSSSIEDLTIWVEVLTTLLAACDACRESKPKSHCLLNENDREQIRALSTCHPARPIHQWIATHIITGLPAETVPVDSIAAAILSGVNQVVART